MRNVEAKDGNDAFIILSGSSNLHNITIIRPL
jgi:hypothetical protein